MVRSLCPVLAATVAMAAAVRILATTPDALRPPTPTDSPIAVRPVAATTTGAVVATAPAPALAIPPAVAADTAPTPPPRPLTAVAPPMADTPPTAPPTTAPLVQA